MRTLGLLGTMAAAALLAGGCGHGGASPVVPSAGLGTPFSLPHGTTVEVDGTLRLRFAAVESDSRCPEDVQCIQAGDAVVRLEATRPGEAAQDLRLHTAPGAGQEAQSGPYLVRLQELRPAPRTTRTLVPSDYVAVVKVDRR